MQSATVCFDEVAGDGEPEPGAGRVAGLDEALEHLLQPIGRDPGPGVLDRRGDKPVRQERQRDPRELLRRGAVRPADTTVML